MGAFIDAHRDVYGVEPIGTPRQMAPLYDALKARATDPQRVPARTQRDTRPRPEMARVWRAKRNVYGAKKVWTATGPDSSLATPVDLVQRNCTATRPNERWVSDFTYVATWRGFVYVALVIDVFARRLVGWRASTSMQSELALDALEQAL